ncbi:hypothetical protein M422DRAFT_782841 [Sphaerobolus stellatus SS14]|uniref:RNase III domain-containing protein n=1 Tax=Sphaerobolus stellatus (strain SS14) TaxID=990650 RepID=A0A0C9UZH8_SPHS4|nr:hypothetical protein M422DRAFT_782841 [Sphaerobolus stellatus SS14]
MDTQTILTGELVGFIHTSAVYHPTLPDLNDETWQSLFDWRSTEGRRRNNRLELLGDSIIGVIITTMMFNRFPDLDPHRMTQLRCALTCNQIFAHLADRISLSENLIRPDINVVQKAYDKAYADLFEAVIGECYLRLPPDVFLDWVLGVFGQLIDVVYGVLQGISGKKAGTQATKKADPTKTGEASGIKTTKKSKRKRTAKTAQPKTALVGAKIVAPGPAHLSRRDRPLQPPVQSQSLNGAAAPPIFAQRSSPEMAVNPLFPILGASSETVTKQVSPLIPQPDLPSDDQFAGDMSEGEVDEGPVGVGKDDK